MVDKDRDQWVEKVLLKIVKEAGRIIQKVAIRNEGIRTSCRCVLGVKAFALGFDDAIFRISVVADTTTGTVEWTKEIRTGLAQSRANECLRQAACICDGQNNLLKVVFARVPNSGDLNLKVHFVQDTFCSIATSFARIGRNAFTVGAIHLSAGEESINQSTG